MTVQLTINGHTYVVTLHRIGTSWECYVNGQPLMLGNTHANTPISAYTTIVQRILGLELDDVLEKVLCSEDTE